MNIFEVLRQDHDKQRALLKALVETSGEDAVRKDFFSKLKQELDTHAIAEERHFYKPLIDHDATVEMSRHGVAEHHQIDKLVAKLEDTDMSSPSWLATMKELQHKVLHHLEEEEREFFQQAGKVLSSKQKEELAELYLDEMEQLAA